MPTAIEEQIITLQQWMSPSFPIGAFAYSHGLEWAIETGRIKNSDDLFNWMSDILVFGSGRNDAILVALAHSTSNAHELNHVALSLCPSRERREETQLQGTAFCAVLRDVWCHELHDVVLPVAIGQAGRLCGFDVSLCVSSYLHAFCSNLISVAVRLVPLGQTAGQKVLLALVPLISDQTETALTSTKDDLSSQTFFSDVASMRHETMHTRIFKT